jgi:hypothetical protein
MIPSSSSALGNQVESSTTAPEQSQPAENPSPPPKDDLDLPSDSDSQSELDQPEHPLEPNTSPASAPTVAQPFNSARSSSPGAPPLSGTLAVIKAQAFGALRRTRSRAKRGADSSAKVALEALEARGIGMGVSTGSKRAQVDYYDEDAD